jgi:hypothetical protein
MVISKSTISCGLLFVIVLYGVPQREVDLSTFQLSLHLAVINQHQRYSHTPPST